MTAVGIPPLDEATACEPPLGESPGECLDLAFLGVSKNAMRRCVVVSGCTCESYGLGRWQANMRPGLGLQLLSSCCGSEAARPAPVGDDQRRLVRRARRTGTGTGGRVA